MSKTLLKLLFYIPGIVDGGAERVVLNLARGFANQGHEVLLVTDFEAHENSPVVAPGIRQIVLKKNHLGSVFALARVIDEEHPAVALSALSVANLKLILASILAQTKSFFLHRKQKRTGIIISNHGFREDLSGRLSWLSLKSLPILSRIADKTISVSDSLDVELFQRWKMARKKHIRIYNPVALPKMGKGFDPKVSTKREDLILGSGRLTTTKNFNLLIHAFAGLSNKKVKLIILGEGPERQRLEALIDELNLANRVSLPGYKKDTGPYYERAKLFVHAAQAEAFGLTIVEALAFGLSVIATDSGGPREILEDGKFGTLVKIDDVKALTREMEKALQSVNSAEWGIQRAEHFSEEIGFRNYLNLFEEVHNEIAAPLSR